jgi:hypothetical protein
MIQKCTSIITIKNYEGSVREILGKSYKCTQIVMLLDELARTGQAIRLIT